MAALARLAARAAEHEALVITGRSHNVARAGDDPRQALRQRRRGAAAGLPPPRRAHRPLPAARPQGPGRHPAGPARPARRRPRQARRRSRAASPATSGSPQVLDNVGQVYPRSLDFDVVSALVQAGVGSGQPGQDHPADGRPGAGDRGLPAPGQVGSSAMPHKMNTRSTERINGFAAILGGHLAMVTGLVGDQWNEGDVSCSVVRRVALPDAFFAVDGLFETLLTVLDEFGAYPGGRRARARALPAVPRHHQGPDGPRAGRRRPGGRPRAGQGARRRRRPRPAGRRRRQPAARPARRRRRACRSTDRRPRGAARRSR